ncbi:MAG: DUF1549 domain-containing protein, partial [Planctomycetota bacterium]
MKLKSVIVLLVIGGALASPVDAGPRKHAKQIDQVVAAELERHGQEPRPGIDDYTFCRRAFLDVIGRIPTIDELDTFVANSQPDKRARLINKLLDSKGYTSHWYNYWADLLRVKYVGDKLHHPGNYGEWIKTSLRENKPYNQMAHELINARGDLYKPGNGATGFYAREPMPLDHLANSVKTFLGLSIECAQCHDHPTDQWSQQDFYRLAAFSSKTHLRVDPQPDIEKATYAKDRKILKNKEFEEWIVYRESVRVKHAAIHGGGTGFTRLPHDYQYKDGEPFEVMPADVLFGTMQPVDYKIDKEALAALNKNNVGPDVNARQSLADWMTSPDNHMFTKATVNRLWHRIMGTELAGPLGGLVVNKMGDHPALTEKLIDIMKATDYDIKAFLRAVMNSDTYQSKALALNTSSPEYILDGPIVRRLPAEVLVDSFLSLRTETPDKYVATEFKWDGFTHFYDKSRDMSVADFVDYSVKGPGRQAFYAREDKESRKRNAPEGPKDLWRVSSYRHTDGNHEVAILMGQSTRDLIDSANTQPDIPQILYLMNGHLEQQITGQPEALLHRKLSEAQSRSERMDIIWKSILGRLPTESEKP